MVATLTSKLRGASSQGFCRPAFYLVAFATAGIVLAIVAGGFGELDSALPHWAEANNPFYAGPNADWLALSPFAALVLFLYLVGRNVLLGTGSNAAPARRAL